MDNLLISALSAVDVRDLSYAEWMNVGMALKHEGYACSVWDEWSRNDQRYHPGECARKWNTFHGSGTPVTGATIVQMAKQRGWKPFEGNGIMDWNDELSYDGTPEISVPSGRAHDGTPGISVPFDNLLPDMKPTAELAKYISTLFRPEEYVGYVTGEVRQNEDGEWEPLRGVFNRTAGELLTSLAKYPDDLGATIGDWKPQVGGWIRFNPLDGTGASDRNVTAFRYALVESDVIPIQEQLAAYQRLELPIACLVSSGGKSVHAIVHIDAPDESEYRKRVLYLYSFLIGHGLIVDQANKNPSRLSRMPGVDRNGNRQKLLAVNTGRRSWQDWMDFVEGLEDDLPPLEDMSALLAHQPELPEELIRGILRCGHKMLISGSSKAGKSFLLMELAIAIAEGRKWLGFPCKKGRVLYVNLEIDRASCINRFAKIYEALHIQKPNAANIVLWNLRGKAVPLDKLVPKLVRRVRDQHFDAIIIDPIYKVITGDENKASDMALFCNQFDKICAETGCAAIYCHHHSKGDQGNKDAKDRASGSGVFARDPDAQLDMIELQLDGDMKYEAEAFGRTAWRLESSLREFPNIIPVDFWFDYPIHTLARPEELTQVPAKGSVAAKIRGGKNCSRDERAERIRMAYAACSFDPDTPVTVSAIASYLDMTDRTVRDWLKEMSDEYQNDRGVVTRI